MDSFLKLYQALDALFPIGSFTMSGGMEAYAQLGVVACKASLAKYFKAQLCILPYNDLGLAAHAALGSPIIALDSLASAMRQPFEARRSGGMLYKSFVKAQAAINYCPSLDEYSDSVKRGASDGHYPIALGLFIRDLGINLKESLELYCYSILSSMANHAAKLVPLPQMDGQRALSEALGGIPMAAALAMASGLDELGIGGPGFDLRAIEHETLPGRLYIS